MPRTQDSGAMYCIPAKKITKPKSCKNQGLEQLLRGQKNNVLHGFRESLKTLRKINNYSAALVPEVHRERPEQCKKQLRIIGNPWENSYPTL